MFGKNKQQAPSSLMLPPPEEEYEDDLDSVEGNLPAAQFEQEEDETEKQTEKELPPLPTPPKKVVKEVPQKSRQLETDEAKKIISHLSQHREELLRNREIISQYEQAFINLEARIQHLEAAIYRLRHI